MISALALDTTPGACAALSDNRCSIHERRPLGCRTVPFHYSRADGLAASDFDAFVSTAGYRCDTGDGAALFLKDGRVVHTVTSQARADALALAERDRPWKEAIVRRMKTPCEDSLPSLADVEANAGFAAMTTSMRVGWQIAAAAGLLSGEAYCALIQQQLSTIERELSRCTADRETLREMTAEYKQALAPERQPRLAPRPAFTRVAGEEIQNLPPSRVR